jgi:hypothetical protein
MKMKKFHNLFFFFLFASFLAPVSVLGGASITSFYCLPFLFLYWLIFDRSLKISATLFSFFLLVIFFGLTALSLISGGSLVIAGGKTAQILILYFIMTLKIKNELFVSARKLTFFFIGTSILVSIFGPGWNEADGTPRFYGFSYDPNFFAAACFAMIVWIEHMEELQEIPKYLFLKVTLLILILFSMSFSILLILTGYVFAKRLLVFNIKRIFWQPVFLFLVFVFPLASFYLAEKFIYFFEYHNNGIYSQFKLSSIHQRLGVQREALEIFTQNPSISLTGVGSGRTLELLERALHNGYLQLVFAHGLLFYVAFFSLVFFVFSNLGRDRRLTKVGIIGVFGLLLLNLSIDTVFSHLLPLLLFLMRQTVFSKLAIVPNSKRGSINVEKL